MLTLVQI